MILIETILLHIDPNLSLHLMSQVDVVLYKPFRVYHCTDPHFLSGAAAFPSEVKNMTCLLKYWHANMESEGRASGFVRREGTC